jgi:hypothetical protein
MEKDGPLDGRKYNKNNKDSQMGQVTPKKIFLSLIYALQKMLHRTYKNLNPSFSLRTKCKINE